MKIKSLLTKKSQFKNLLKMVPKIVISYILQQKKTFEKIIKTICISSINREKVKGNLGSFLKSHAIFHDLLIYLPVWISISQPLNFLPHRAL